MPATYKLVQCEKFLAYLQEKILELKERAMVGKTESLDILFREIDSFVQVSEGA